MENGSYNIAESFANSCQQHQAVQSKEKNSNLINN